MQELDGGFSLLPLSGQVGSLRQAFTSPVINAVRFRSLLFRYFFHERSLYRFRLLLRCSRTRASNGRRQFTA